MIVDSSAVIAILRQESEAAELSHILASARLKRMGAPSYVEICLVMAGSRGPNPLEKIDRFIRLAQIEIIPFSAAAARVAVDAFIKYGKGRHPASLNFGDCISYALARTEALPLLFKGGDFPLTDIVPAL